MNLYTLPELPYAYNSLEPFIDEKTMRIHHTKHHQAYVDNLNDAIKKYPELQNLALEHILANLADVPLDVREKVRNHGGGHSNHTLFWSMMTPNRHMPSEELKNILAQAFGSFEKWQEYFIAAALGRFGSGWAWTVYNNQTKQFEIMSTQNQDSPYMTDMYPILGIDVWEHAYYLLYQNQRREYIQAWFLTVNWDYMYQRILHHVK